MKTYHVNDKGMAGVCSAVKGKCPFGGLDSHYENVQDARKAYEKRMEQGQILNPTSAEDLKSMRTPVDAPPTEQVAYAEKMLVEAGDYASKRLTALWNTTTRTYADEAQGEFFHDHLHSHVLVVFDFSDAKECLENSDKMGAIEALEKAQAHLKICGKQASDQMMSLWDKENKKYMDNDQANTLHSLINALGKSMNRVRFAIRDLRKQTLV